MVEENYPMTFEIAVGFLANAGVRIMIDETLPEQKQSDLKDMVLRMVEGEVLWKLMAETPQDKAENLIEDALLVPVIRDRLADPRPSVSLDKLAAELCIKLDSE